MDWNAGRRTDVAPESPPCYRRRRIQRHHDRTAGAEGHAGCAATPVRAFVPVCARHRLRDRELRPPSQRARHEHERLPRRARSFRTLARSRGRADTGGRDRPPHSGQRGGYFRLARSLRALSQRPPARRPSQHGRRAAPARRPRRGGRSRTGGGRLRAHARRRTASPRRRCDPCHRQPACGRARARTLLRGSPGASA